MKLIKHSDFIYEYENFASSIDCDNIINLIEMETPFVSESIYKPDKNKIRNNIAYPISQLSNNYPSMGKADEIAHKIISACNSKYSNDNKFISKFSYLLNTSEKFCSNYIYRVYDKTDYYDWHVDYSENKQFVVSLILYLNDDFEGGSTLFLTDKVKVRPKKGSVLCFPCDLRTIHKSTPIKSGTKKIIWTCVERKIC